MRLYLMRHGAAVEAAQWEHGDDTRPLTDAGRRETLAVLENLVKNVKPHVAELWSSPLVRARQTADLAAEALGLEVRLVKNLACGASLSGLRSAVRKLRPQAADLMLVGHEPDCGVLIADLVGDLEADYALKKSEVALLEGRFAPAGMRLVWRLAPANVLRG